MDSDVIQKQALAVDPPDEYFDPELQPETGEQYLQKVIYERKHCPAVVVAKPSPKRRHQEHQQGPRGLSGSGAIPMVSRMSQISLCHKIWRLNLKTVAADLCREQLSRAGSESLLVTIWSLFTILFFLKFDH